MANAFWPNVSTPKSAHRACEYAAYSAYFVAGMTAFASLASLAGSEVLASRGFSVYSLIDAAIIAALGVGVRRRSRVAAVLLVVTYAAVQLLGLGLTVERNEGQAAVLLTTILFLGVFIGGARGAFAMARFEADSDPAES